MKRNLFRCVHCMGDTVSGDLLKLCPRCGKFGTLLRIGVVSIDKTKLTYFGERRIVYMKDNNILAGDTAVS